MGKLIMIILVIAGLSYFGFIKINTDTIKSAASAGVNKISQANTAQNRAKVKEATQAAVAKAQAYAEANKK